MGIPGIRAIAIQVFMILLILASANAFSQDNNHTVTIDKWLHLGNFKVMKPAFYDQKSLKGKAYQATDLLSHDFIDIKNLSPKQEAEVKWKNSNPVWNLMKTSKSGDVKVDGKSKDEGNKLAYLAAYVTASRWIEAKMEVHSPQMFEVYLDGKKIKSKESEEAEGKDAGSITTTLKLEKGKHLVVIKTLKTQENDAGWRVKAELSFGETFPSGSLYADTDPAESMTIHHLLNGTFITGATISPDGQLVLLKYSETSPGGNRSSWAEVRELESGQLIQSFRETKMQDIRWIPAGRAISWETSDKDSGSSLWMLDFSTMESRRILENIKDFGSYAWSDDASFIIFSVSANADQDDGNLKLYEGMPDRWPWWRSRSFLFHLDVESGITGQLTHGHITTSLMDIRGDGQKILFSQNVPDFSERPYSRQYLMEMDLNTFAVDTVWEKNFSGSCQYAPDGVHLLVTGSPALFGNAGVNLTGDAIPNDYDTQAYIYDMMSGDAEPITYNFNPSIQGQVWSKFDENKIYFLAEDHTYKHLFVYDLNTRYFEKTDTGFDVINSFSLATQTPAGVFTGSGISTPKYAVSVNLSDGETKTIATPREETYRNVVFGETSEWNFVNKNGTEIEGRIYYPPDFDKSKKYPLIVYYYGGTSPTSRSFGGRYPKNIFAAGGYVVYNLQPSGATGYGQDFSAAHVNNWGITVADEIIDGTKQFLDDHEFIDRGSVGCIGASYGGFMTMLLQTRTDIFAAAISHAGISSIASYWGEGYWGYLYSSVATANSFPWNNKKLYVEQSALFNADKINTPMLLLHGEDDTNVPPGESIQLYTALKLLGKPVELIGVKGQNHQIIDYQKRIEWQNTIFAWFDKWLKDQPEWWNDLYPERNL